MWGKALLVALLALGVGVLYQTQPDLPAQVLRYITEGGARGPSAEQAISSAWETLITLPSRQWRKVAVG
jgi:ubiquinone biosynthesis protein Coq4